MSNADSEAVRKEGDAAPTAWISRGFEELVARRDREPAPDTVDCDVLIVGSGYGGAIAAARLAGTKDASGRKQSVFVLERGREYLPGMFPPRMSDLAGHVRFSADGAGCARGEREGLFDVRIGVDVGAVVANGLGGGSLINAGVMAKPGEEVFKRRAWPKQIRDESADDRDRRFAQVKEALGGALRADRIPGRVSAPGHEHDLVDNTVDLNPDRIPEKYKVLKRMASVHGGAPKPFGAAAITVALTEKRESSARVALDECVRCGDCATGCNHGAKDSLDVNLLRTAERAGAHIYTGATVLRLAQRHVVENGNGVSAAGAGVGSGVDGAAPNAWVVDVVHTDADLRARQGGPFRLVARKVILAAGAFGSTEILLRSRSDVLVFSARLGQCFSTNGDMIAVAYDQRDRAGGKRVPVNAIADERQSPRTRHVGPTITGIIDLRNEKAGVVIEEMAVPGPLRRVFEEIVTTGNTLRQLGRIDLDAHAPGKPDHDPCAVDGEAIESSSIFAVMGDDGAGGALELTGDADDENDGDGAIRVRWPEARDHRVFTDGIKALRALGEDSRIDGDVQANPAWQTVPDDMQFLMDDKRGPLMTVHPLGGCPMGDAAIPVQDPLEEKGTLLPQGAVNEIGQVFDCAKPTDMRTVFDSLVVLDGSIVPTSLGINPSLTIAALAWRAVEGLQRVWNLSPPSAPNPEPSVRPVFRELPDPPEVPVATEGQIIERMSGEALLPAIPHGTILSRVELTLHFVPAPLAPMFLPDPLRGRSGEPVRDGDPRRAGGKVPMKRELVIDREKSHVRVFVAEEWNAWHRGAGREEELDELAHFCAPVAGSLAFMQREASTYKERRCRAIPAWLFNRGIRDTWQAVAEKVKDLILGVREKPLDPPDEDEKKSICMRVPFLRDPCRRLRKRLKALWALASHGGEVRLFEYALTIDKVPDKKIDKAIDFDAMKRQHAIRGRKRITYGRKSNPWWQMSRLSLDVFPGLQQAPEPPVLDLDVSYLTQQGVPILKILRQQDEVAAIGDLGALAGYFLRLLLTLHVWSFRKPDPADPGEPQRLPGIVKGLPDPEISEFDVATLPDGRPVRARLTRYARRASTLPPLLMIPGYSASGTTYAHPALDPHAAGFFWDHGRDIWILDMRTSCGMPTARMPWKFEDAALADIPWAIDYIWHTVDAERAIQNPASDPLTIDVLAHCMGSVMFSMALLAPPEPGDPYYRERHELPLRVGKVVLSQIGPVVVFTPANVLRAYLMSYLRNFLPLANYEFRIGPAPSLADQLIDRALATMPYPDKEFGIENPWFPPCKRTPWVGSRHRMDALYGRDFNVDNMSPRVLAVIDDLFGPLSTDTVSQAIHFARLGVITNYAGRNVFATRRNLLERWGKTRPTLSIHGQFNGLYDVSTLARMNKLFKTDLGLNFKPHQLDGMGHQDCLIGKRAREVFGVVEDFLEGREIDEHDDRPA